MTPSHLLRALAAWRGAVTEPSAEGEVRRAMMAGGFDCSRPRLLRQRMSVALIAAAFLACGDKRAAPSDAGIKPTSAAAASNPGPPAVVLTEDPPPPPLPPPPAPPLPPPTVEPSPPPSHPIPATEEGLTGRWGTPRRPARPPRPGWPLSTSVPHEECVTAAGEPGYRLVDRPGRPCFNPCPVGMAPGAFFFQFCERFCSADADCDGGRCESGRCNSLFATADAIFHVDGCRLLDGRPGRIDEKRKLCLPDCKIGLVLMGGTDCVKPCTSAADCPGGRCMQDNPSNPFRFCGPGVCPSEGCPYPWE